VSFAFFVLGFVAVVNPPRVRLGLPGESARVRASLLVPGAALVFAGAVVLAAVAGRLLEALEVSPETFRLAAGLVLAVEGAWTLLRPRPGPEPVLPGRLAALVPVAFPLLLTPGLVALALAAGADMGPGRAAGAIACGLLLVLPTLPFGEDPREQALLAAAGRLGAALEIAAAAGLALEGLRSV
jgi:small neutral amino acid transporter SnatA (MarC family)